MAQFDTIIKGGTVVDGTRVPRYKADIGIKDDKITEMGRINSSDAKKVIDFYLKRGSNLNDIYAVIGPCISQKNYEVKIDFKNRFIKQNSKNTKYFLSKSNKIFFSLRDYISGQLLKFGVKNIEIIKKDTFNVKNNFFSARRSLKNKNNDYGRNISIIMIK